MFRPYQRLSRLRYERDLLSLHEITVEESFRTDDVTAPLVDVPDVSTVPTTENVQEDTPFFDNEPALSDADSVEEAKESEINVEMGIILKF